MRADTGLLHYTYYPQVGFEKVHCSTLSLIIALVRSFVRNEVLCTLSLSFSHDYNKNINLMPCWWMG